jgi:hypothetical protein
MTTIKNTGNFSFTELCEALEFDSENDFLFTPISESKIIKVQFKDYFPVMQISSSKNAQIETTINVTDDIIKISLGEEITAVDETQTILFSAIETVLADYILRVLLQYREQKKKVPDQYFNLVAANH